MKPKLTLDDSQIDELVASDHAAIEVRNSDVYADWLAVAGDASISVADSSVGALRLHLASRQAHIDGRVADLSDREFRVLHFLMAHVGEVVSRERLLAEVWGYDFDPRSNVVDVCVRRLRRRLGPQAPIETVRNAGYRAAA